MSDDLRDLVRRIERASTPRRLNRPPVNIPIVVDGDGRHIEGLGRDINEHGLRLRSRQACSLHERVRVRLQPPGFGRALTVAAEIRWVRPDATPGEYSVGLEFAHTDDTRRAVRKLLVMHAKKALPAIQRTGHTTRRKISRGCGDEGDGQIRPAVPNQGPISPSPASPHPRKISKRKAH